MTWSRSSTVKKARNVGDRPGGFSLKADPTLPPTSKAIVDGKSKRHGTVKKVGSKFAHSGDNYSQKFGSPHAALRHFSVHKKVTGDDSSGGKSDKGSGDKST